MCLICMFGSLEICRLPLCLLFICVSDATQIDYLEQSIRTLGLTHQNHSDGTSVQSFASAVEHNTNGQMKVMTTDE